MPQTGAPPARPRAGPKPPEAVAEILPPESTAPEALLERGFQELVRFYRHSCCGRLCRGIVHRMSAPLQALFFLLELLEHKSLEELKILPGPCLPGTEQVQTLHHYRLQKIQQFRRELQSLQDLTRNLILQGGHEEAEGRRQLSLNEVFGRELELYQASRSSNTGWKNIFISSRTCRPSWAIISTSARAFATSWKTPWRPWRTRPTPV